MQDNRFIKIKTAPYALPKLLYALYTNGVMEVTMTKEDDELVLTIPMSTLEELVYPRKKDSYIAKK